MHVRVRLFGKPDAIVVVESKLTKIDQFRRIIKEKFDVQPKLQRLFYGGKLLENGYTFHDYNIKLNDVIQLMVRAEPEESSDKPEFEKVKNDQGEDSPKTQEKAIYTDAESSLYAVGDLIDMRDMEQGAWFEGKIVRIVLDPKVLPKENNTTDTEVTTINHKFESNDKQENSENKPPVEPNEDSQAKSKKKGIAKYFSKSPKSKKKSIENQNNNRPSNSDMIEDSDLLFKVELESEDNESEHYCKLKDIRPRARTVIDINKLKVGQKVMVNHNTEDISEKGYWYDFKVDEIKKQRTNYELVGTLYLGPEAVPQNDTKVRVNDKIFAIEEVVALADRSEVYKKLMITPPDKRAQPLECLTCRDDEDAPCRDCGCFECLGKENPEKIVLCDECNHGYHMDCLKPALKELPEDDWYCPSCKRDTKEVIAPGAAKQTKKNNASKKDWGRGMACVGKTKTCAMPPNHFGPIPGIEVGMCWRFRIQLSETGVHRPPVSGIHGRDVEGAYSIVLSGGYEDDVDNGIEFTYTGSGGRDLSGNKRTAEQSCDQTLTRENKALARNCAVKQISEQGGDAGAEWRGGKPVRVVRSYKMMKHFPKYAPKEGIRYDGIYKVVKYYPEKGLSGYRVWKYLLRRDDPNPAPWEPGAKEYPIIYPDGYLEAEAEKKALKEKSNKNAKVKKRALRESNRSESDGEVSPPSKKQKTEEKKKKGRPSKNKSVTESPNAKIPNMFAKSPKTNKGIAKEAALSPEEEGAIKGDSLNEKLWTECLQVLATGGKRDFVEHVTQVFLCIICQEVAVIPVTTPCLHNFCLACIKLAFKSTGTRTCPCCRNQLNNYEPEPNSKLKMALQTVMPGYDAGR
ncbi:E3 ubiquitin-protein ligase UHRF1-like [Plodia interpunctella]|uniref:E3 ubiquitin-protein ligase UHRF1-like n=1 Tax=Plodia interpunctella TaxID=58824 RepID=UPI00236871C3|nr:E3 ubiquitin-protein ligase UHRF1-like [Plodia interpunctella]